MNLSIKEGRRNLQTVYNQIVKSYTNESLQQMKVVAKEFVVEMRLQKHKARGFENIIEGTQTKTKLLTFITNLHMQDSSETAGLSKI